MLHEITRRHTSSPYLHQVKQLATKHFWILRFLRFEEISTLLSPLAGQQTRARHEAFITSERQSARLLTIVLWGMAASVTSMTFGRTEILIKSVDDSYTEVRDTPR